MALLVPITMFGWLGVVLMFYAYLPPRRAVIYSLIGGWLFLPMAEYDFVMLPPWSKATVTTYCLYFAILLFDRDRLQSLRLKLIDIPLLLYCCAPFFSSMSNDLGLWDGLTGIFNRFIVWGGPYFIGRMFFSRPEDFRELALGIFIGGLIYVPFCLYEMRMSPQLHRLVYGFSVSSYISTIRLGGYRPTVFMQHGLMVGIWMCMALVMGAWLWRSGVVKRVLGVPIGLAVAVQFVTLVLCRALNGYALAMLTLSALFVSKWTRNRVPLVVLALIPALYPFVRINDAISIDPALEMVASVVETQIDPARAKTFRGRLNKEGYYVAHAWERPICGWGGFDRAKPTEDEAGQQVRGIDALWIGVFGTNGLLGLGSLWMATLLPTFLILYRHGRSALTQAPLAPALVSAAVVPMYMIDNLMNAMFNPLLVALVGGLAGFVTTYRPNSRRRNTKRGGS